MILRPILKKPKNRIKNSRKILIALLCFIVLLAILCLLLFFTLTLGEKFQSIIEVLSKIETIIASLVAAIITAGYSTYNTRKQAEIKIAENRQVWVNSLREAFAKYLSCVRQELYAKNRKNKPTYTDNNVNDIQYYSSFILLLMNNNDKQYKNLNLLMEYLNNVCHSGYCSQFRLDEAHTAVYNLETLAQCILKIEWNRIKDELHMAPKANEYYNEKVYEEEPYQEKIKTIDSFVAKLQDQNEVPE